MAPQLWWELASASSYLTSSFEANFFSSDLLWHYIVCLIRSVCSPPPERHSKRYMTRAGIEDNYYTLPTAHIHIGTCESISQASLKLCSLSKCLCLHKPLSARVERVHQGKRTLPSTYTSLSLVGWAGSEVIPNIHYCLIVTYFFILLVLLNSYSFCLWECLEKSYIHATRVTTMDQLRGHSTFQGY